MGRNSELIRQWTLLQKVAGARDSTIPNLAEALGVSTRTIRRDLAALQEAGFPVYDDARNGSNSSVVKIVSAGAFGAWIDRQARRIDQMPLLGVDPELLDFSQGVAQSLRTTAAMNRTSSHTGAEYRAAGWR